MFEQKIIEACQTKISHIHKLVNTRRFMLLLIKVVISNMAITTENRNTKRYQLAVIQKRCLQQPLNYVNIIVKGY